MVIAKGKFLLLIGMLLLVVQACVGSSGDEPVETWLPEGSQPGSPAIAAESEGLRAVATSPISVRLTWTAVDGATGYELEGAYGDEEFLPISAVGASVTTVEIVPVPPESQITYRLTTNTASGQESSRQVTLATPALAPNPTTVQATIEMGQISIPGIDLENIDPETFDWSTVDPSVFSTENFDPASLMPEPTTVTQEIGPEGGRLEAVGLNGVHYELIIPEGALPMAIDVSITPIASIEGMPEGVELLGAVQIEPAGIPLAAPVMLLVRPSEPAAESAEAMLVGIGFDGGGEDFHFLPIDGLEIAGIPGGRSYPGLASLPQQPSSAIGSTVVFEFQSQGVVRAAPQTIVSHSQQHAAASPSRATRQSLAAGEAAQRSEGQGVSAVNDELAPLVHVDSFEWWLSSNILDRVRSSPELPDQMAALDDFEILLDKWGDDLPSDRLDALWNEVIERIIHPLLQRSANAPCLSYYHLTGLILGQRLGHPASDFDRELVQRYLERYGAEGRDLIEKTSQIAERCPLTLEVYSEITVHFNECPVERPCHLDHFVQTDSNGLRLSWAGLNRANGQLYLVTAGKLEYRRLEGRSAPGCLWTIPGGAAQPPQLRVMRLALELEPYEGGTRLNDFVLERYGVSGGHTQSRIVGMAGRPTEDCNSGGMSVAGAGDFWWTAYGSIMRPNFTIRDWNLTPGSTTGVLAQRYLDHEGVSVSPDYLGGGRAEGCTIFRIVDGSNRSPGGSNSNPLPHLTCR